jgi:2-furoyl-CoA dehydrogenase large subunit
MKVRLLVNGEHIEAEVEPRLSLADFLRHDLRLRGTHVGCEHGVCGACTVLLDGQPARSCLLFAGQLEGAHVTTVEGLPAGPLQERFAQAGALQCGFCTPGILITAQALLSQTPSPSREQIRQALAGNLCMCTGYVNIVNAIAGEAQPEADQPDTWVGQSLPRKEDARLLSGLATFIDDIDRPGLLHAALLRSPYAHARIVSIDGSAAARLPGVAAVVTGPEAAELTRPIRPLIDTGAKEYCLAHDRARYVGEPVAAVAAVDRATAEDALARIAVTYEPLAAVVDPEAAMRPDAPLLYDDLGTNVLWHDTLTYGDVDAAFAAADGILSQRFDIQRYASTPLETFGCIAEYDPGLDSYAFRTNDQRPGLTLSVLGESLGVPVARLRLACPDIGGGFGNKRRPAYLLTCALLARRAGRPVKYVEDRLENLTALMHAASGFIELDLAYRADGEVLGLRVRDVVDEGKNLVSPTQHNLIKLGNIANGYRIPAIQYTGSSVLTTKCPAGANRGIGKPFMCFAIERAMTLLARRLDMDPGEVRLRNYVQPAAMPYTTPTGARYDSGDYPSTLRLLLDRLDYAGWRTRQAAARTEARLIGIGLASSVEPAGTNLASYELVTGRRGASGSAEAAMVRLEADGEVWVALGDPPSGQGYETAVAQVVADVLAIHPRRVHVQRGFDSSISPWLYLSGNYSNKFSVTDVGAVVGAAEKVRDKLLRLGAYRLEVAPEDLELHDGGVRLAGLPERALSFKELARSAYADVLGLPPGEEPGLEARCFYQNPEAQPVDQDRRVRGQLIFANSAHGCVVEIDPGTGGVSVLKYVVAHDIGRELNPRIVEGMVHGATLHGLGAALLEEFRYAEDGQLLTRSFMEYLKPTSAEAPDIEVARLETPSPFTALGMKGVGEGGAIPAPAAIASAVEDALARFGVTVRSLPVTPERIVSWLDPTVGRDAQSRT